jgi:hypothetical protein
LIPYIPPILLCLVAFLQLFLVRAHDLTPWRGGGFGMFSTNDDESRLIEVWVTDAQGERPTVVTLEQWPTPVTALPSETRLAALGRRVAEAERARGNEVRSVRVAAWRSEFTAPAMRPERRLIREVVVDLDEHSRSR